MNNEEIVKLFETVTWKSHELMVDWYDFTKGGNPESKTNGRDYFRVTCSCKDYWHQNDAINTYNYYQQGSSWGQWVDIPATKQRNKMLRKFNGDILQCVQRHKYNTFVTWL